MNIIEIKKENELYLINVDKINYINAYETNDNNFEIMICFTTYKENLYLCYEIESDFYYDYNLIKNKVL